MKEPLAIIGGGKGWTTVTELIQPQQKTTTIDDFKEPFMITRLPNLPIPILTKSTFNETKHRKTCTKNRRKRKGKK